MCVWDSAQAIPSAAPPTRHSTPIITPLISLGGGVPHESGAAQGWDHAIFTLVPWSGTPLVLSEVLWPACAAWGTGPGAGVSQPGGLLFLNSQALVPDAGGKNGEGAQRLG